MSEKPLTNAEWDHLLDTARTVLIASYTHQKKTVSKKLHSFDQLNWYGLKQKIQQDLPEELWDAMHAQTRMNFIIDWLETALCE